MDNTHAPSEIILTFLVAMLVAVGAFAILNASTYTKTICSLEASNGLEKTACIIQHTI